MIHPVASMEMTIRIPKFRIESPFTYLFYELGMVRGDYAKHQNILKIHASKVYDPGLALSWFYNNKHFEIEYEDHEGKKGVLDCYILNFDDESCMLTFCF